MLELLLEALIEGLEIEGVATAQASAEAKSAQKALKTRKYNKKNTYKKSIEQLQKADPKKMGKKNLAETEKRLINSANSRIWKLKQKGYDVPPSAKNKLNEFGRFQTRENKEENIKSIQEFLRGEGSSLTKLRQNREKLGEKLGEKLDVEKHNKFVQKMGDVWEKLGDKWTTSNLTSDDIFGVISAKIDEEFSTLLDDVISFVDNSIEAEDRIANRIEDKYNLNDIN